MPSLPPPRRLAPLLGLTLALLASGCDARRLRGESPPCQRCHGGNGSAAPPVTVRGHQETTARAVGAHRRHLEPHADSVRAPIACRECHVVPRRPDDDHYRDAHATITWTGDLAALRGAAPAWDPASETCASVYCHGGTLGEGSRGSATAPVWTRVDGTQRTCGSCHGDPPASHAVFRDRWQCDRCHPGTVLARATEEEPARIDVAGGQHIDGSTAVAGGACNLCHDAPPDTGAHRAHATPAALPAVAYGSLAVLEDVSPAGGTSYEFGCGHCHPLDLASHLADAGEDGLPDVLVAPPAAPPAGDRVKSRNLAAAAWDPATGTCSGVYCHSSGQDPAATLAYRTTPAWTAAPGSLGCAGCHDNPPRYATGGPGSATANSHLGLDDWGWESGHFVGMPGPAHPYPSKHGGASEAAFADPFPAAAPITCQACHAETVDPDNVASGGFFWLDTTGDYRLPGGDAARLTSAWWTLTQCSRCHFEGGTAPVQAGRVLALRHVNGRRDVTFDRRSALPDSYGGSLPPVTGPVPPYYVTYFGGQASKGYPALPADAVLLSTTAASRPVFATSLAHAAYDPATKTCSNVGCHLGRQSLVDAGTLGPLEWGAPYEFGPSCGNCHQGY